MRFINNSNARRALCLAALCAALCPATVHSQKTSAQKGRTKGRAGSAQQAKPTSTPAPSQGAKAAQQIGSNVTVRWRGQPGIERYRLQIARDEGFNDIVFDEAVTGRSHTLSLPTGLYYWHVAPAMGETGRYSTAQPVQVTSEPAIAEERVVVSASGGGGWRTATGEMPYIVPARLRAGQGLDLVGVNTDGTVFAISGANGVALWTARYSPGAKRGEETAKPALFTPLAVLAAEGGSNVVVAFDGGLRALKGETGRELWRAPLSGRPVSATASDTDGDGGAEIIALTADPSSLVVLDGATGNSISITKLSSRPLGAPAILNRDGARLILLGYEDGMFEARGMKGEVVSSVKLDTGVTTPPLALTTSRAQIVVVGSGNGLFALSAKDLSVVGKIETGTDAPRGSLLASDMDGDSNDEIVMLTRAGRVAVIGTSDGRIRWVAEGATESATAALADLNGDGVLDVITAAGQTFANGFSGRDGALIWKVEDMSGGRPIQSSKGTGLRSVVITTSGSDALLVGGDTARMGLRAVELPKGAVRVADK